MPGSYFSFRRWGHIDSPKNMLLKTNQTRWMLIIVLVWMGFFSMNVASMMEPEYRVEWRVDGERISELTYLNKPDKEQLLKDVGYQLGPKDQMALRTSAQNDQELTFHIHRWRTEMVELEEVLPYDTEVQESDHLLKGEEEILQKGQEGLHQVKKRLTYLGAEKKDEEVLFEFTQDPTPKIVKRGVKEIPGYSKIAGQDYEVQAEERGIASFYADRFHGRMAFSGEIYDMHQLTAAHPTLPMQSIVRVTFMGTGQQVILRINDRGPCQRRHPDRVIDVSKRAADELGLTPHGLGKVKVEVLRYGQ